MSAPRKIEIEQTSNGFRIRVLSDQSSGWEYYQALAVKSVIPAKVIGMGVRQSDNNRKMSILHDDMLKFAITFHDENESNPVMYDIQDVDNQPTWTPDAAGLAQAILDINSWLGTTSSAISTILSVLTGNTEGPYLTEDIASGVAGATSSDVKGFSIKFEGSGGKLDGVNVDSGDIFNYSASLGNVLGSVGYLVPNVADPDFVNSPRVVISYTM